MHTRSTYFAGGIAIIILAVSFAFKENSKGNLNISIHHLAGELPLKLDSGHYKNSFNQEFTVSKLKYYLGRFELRNKNRGTFKNTGYFLVDEENPESKEFALKDVDEGEYTGIDFILGVDSADNCNGAQSGALDPVNAMFWTWNTGYIFLKFEGYSSHSRSPGHLFEFHIGGFKQPVNSIRRFRFNFNEPLLIKHGGQNKLELTASVLKLMDSPNAIDLAKISSITDLKNAQLVADNYASLFSCHIIKP